MLLTELSTWLAIFLAASLAFSVLCMVFMWRINAYCRSAVEFVLNQNKNAVSLRRMADVEGTLTDLLDSYAALLSSHKKLRARIGMRATREERANGLDSSATTDKNQLRHAAKQKGLI